ncbi:radical SAM family heme chaperone HemW [Halomonas sp. GXIMD04776]|uniref:radical SAM family heme chaperone HemW n=1 Tax=Halomonas sp. GXIMD04776 TaxID=3415605 RepID=UPI003C8E6DA9
MMKLPPLALYVHVPWCVRKCPYCDFNSHGIDRSRELPERAYLAALLADLEEELTRIIPRELVSIFIGGGTPSLMSSDFYRHLLKGVDERLELAPDCEITIEANPGTLEQGRFGGYRDAGINRLSLGVQSFQPEQLKALGRIHDGEQAYNAVNSARSAGFDNLNLDLMHGLPQQDVALALADIEQALALTPEHLSWYQLTLEPNTEFYSHPPSLPGDEVLWDIQDAGHERLERAGLLRYEISAYARQERRSRHNLNYWQFGDYMGIGAGAHGKLSRWSENGGLIVERYWKSRQPASYLRRHHDPRGFLAGSQRVATSALPLEFAMNALRLVNGVSLQQWPRTSGRPVEELENKLVQAREKGLLINDPLRLKASPKGLLFLNDLLASISDS